MRDASAAAGRQGAATVAAGAPTATPTEARVDGHRSLAVSTTTVGLVVGLGALGVLLALRAVLPEVFVPPIVAVVPPLVVASFTSSVVTAIVGAAAVPCGALLLALDGSGWRSWLVELAVMGVATAVSVFLADRRERREAELEALRTDDARAADRRATRSAQLLASVADGVDEPIFVKDATGRYLFANRATASALGGEPASVVGRRDGDLLPAALAAALGENDREVVATGERRLFEEAGPWAPGRAVYATTKVPYRDADGTVIGVIGVGRDITERVRAEARAQALQDLAVRLAGALRPADVADAVLDASTAVSPTTVAASLAVIDRDAESLRMLGVRGVAREDAEPFVVLPVDGSSMHAHVIATGTPAEVRDRSEIPQDRPLAAAALDAVGASSGLWLPVPSAGETIGVLGHAYGEPLADAGIDRELLDAIASRCGQALERASLYEAEARQRSRAELGTTRATHLAELTRAFSAASDVDDLVEVILDIGLRALGAPLGAVYGFDHEHGCLRLLGARLGAGWHNPAEVDLEDPGPLANAARSGLPVLSFDLGRGGTAGRAWAAVPLSAYGSLKGVLEMHWSNGPPVLGPVRVDPDDDADERRFLASVGARCGEALERTQLHAAERQARMEAQRRAATLTDLQRITTELSRAVTSAEVAATVLDALTWRLGGPGALLGVALDGEGSGRVLDARGVATARPGDPLDASGFAGLGGALELTDPDELRQRVPGIGTLLADAGYRAASLRPLRSRRLRAVLALGWAAPPDLDAATTQYVDTLVTLAGQALDRASSFDDEHAIADTVQRSLLPRLPAAMGSLRLVGRFSPGNRRVLVGGDWFDAFDMGDGLVGLCVGDVEGRGIAAATCMGQVRAALHALATDIDDPGALVARLRWSSDVATGPMVTLALVVVAGRELRYVHAGHPPSLLRAADGRVSVLEGGRAVPLGVGLASLDRTATATLPAGATLVMYTDGLIERRGETLDDGIARLEAALADGPDDLDALADHLLARCVQPGGGDDVCLLLVRG